jgi:hypothetical protein
MLSLPLSPTKDVSSVIVRVFVSAITAWTNWTLLQLCNKSMCLVQRCTQPVYLEQLSKLDKYAWVQESCCESDCSVQPEVHLPYFDSCAKYTVFFALNTLFFCKVEAGLPFIFLFLYLYIVTSHPPFSADKLAYHLTISSARLSVCLYYTDSS